MYCRFVVGKYPLSFDTPTCTLWLKECSVSLDYIVQRQGGDPIESLYSHIWFETIVTLSTKYLSIYRRVHLSVTNLTVHPSAYEERSIFPELCVPSYPNLNPISKMCGNIKDPWGYAAVGTQGQSPVKMSLFVHIFVLLSVPKFTYSAMKINNAHLQSTQKKTVPKLHMQTNPKYLSNAPHTTLYLANSKQVKFPEGTEEGKKKGEKKEKKRSRATQPIRHCSASLASLWTSQRTMCTFCWIWNKIFN